MKIDILANDGSPLGVTMNSVWGKDGRIGVGGSELAILTLCEGWTEMGYDVRFYNDPKELNVSKFYQLPINTFDPKDNRDVLIVFRTPNPLAIVSKGMKVWLSFDQFTSTPFGNFSGMVDKIVGISEYHSKYFKDHYNIDNMTIIDLPVRMDDFQDVEKVPGRLIFTSVPDRGLNHLHAIWPLIKRECEDASLVITSDYRLWGSLYPDNKIHMVNWMGADDAQFRGALSRRDYLTELCKADILVYPHTSQNSELFCISVAEAQYAKTFPVTSNFGALETTNMGMVLSGDPNGIPFRLEFADKVVNLLNDGEALLELQREVHELAEERFNLDSILEQWENKVFT